MAGAAERIVRVEGFEIACDLPEPVGNALRIFTRRSALLIRLTTAGGLSGWGETWAFPAPAAAFIRTVLAPVILGSSVMAPRKLHADMMPLVVPDRRGLALMAVSAIDIAAWDAFGRAVGQPIHALLGGALRSSLPAYASGPLLPVGPDRYRGLEESLEQYLSAGFQAVKIRIGLGLGEDEAAIRRARGALGLDVQLMVDMNEASTVHDALALAHRVEDVGLRWIEEPVRHDDLPAYRFLAGAMPVPLAGGESFCGVQAFRDALSERTLDVVQPDVALCGGFTESLRICGLADAFGVPVVPHVWGAAPSFLAAMQLATILPPQAGAAPFPLLECDMSRNPLRDSIFALHPDAAGTVALPDGPGLGLEIDIGALAGFITEHWVLE